MSFLRSYVEIKKKREEAQKNGNVGAICLLMIMGGLFLASHAMCVQMGHVHGSLKNFFKSTKSQRIPNGEKSVMQGTHSVTKNVAQALAKDSTQQVLDNTGAAVNINDEKGRD